MQSSSTASRAAPISSRWRTWRAAKLMRTASLVRLFDGSDWVIERYIARGVDGIVVPRLDSADQAASVIRAVRYCLPKSHQDKVVVIQIETRDALTELDRFIELPGVDVLFLGPVDLAKSLGFEGDHRHPDVQRTLMDAVMRIRRAGKAPGILVDRGSVRRWCRRAQAGALFLYEHADSLLAIGADEIAKSVAEACGQLRLSQPLDRQAPP